MQYISQSYERFTPEGQQRWQAMEDRHRDLLARAEKSTKALKDKQTYLAAYRKELKEHGYKLPFTPELYRLAVEMSTPDGWDTEGVDSVWNLMQVESPGQTGEKAIPYSERGTEPEPKVDVHLKYKKGWSEAQKAAADAKLRICSDADTVKTEVKRTNSAKLRAEFKQKFGLEKIPEGCDLDHVVDLQIGGRNDIMNTQLLDRSVNRSLGSQIYHAIKDYEVGTPLGQFTIE